MKARCGAVVFVLLMTSSCAHSVRMISVPEGAQITVDGKKVGRAPILFRERSGPIGFSHEIKAEIPGQAPITFKKEPDRICPTPANMILDTFYVGFLFGFCLRDEYIFDFTVASARVSGAPKPLPITSH